MSEDLIVEKQDGVTLLTLNRPEKRNALNIALMNRISEEMKKACSDPKQRVIILRGEGPVFCSGLDLAETLHAPSEKGAVEAIAQMLEAVYTCPLVTIATIHGVALAGGAGLMSACDFVIAAENTRIGYPETRIGLAAGLVMTLLVRQVHPKHIHELLLLAEPILSDKALEIGIINQVVPEWDLKNTALEYARRVMKGAPKATTETKRFLQELSPHSFKEDLQKAIDFHYRIRQSDEAKEGMQAFLEKREPVWE